MKTLTLTFPCLLLWGFLAGTLLSAQNQPATAHPQTSASASLSAKLGVFVYPKNNQAPQQQSADESACYSFAQQQTGIDPTAPPPAPQEAQKKHGGAVKGAARGAAGGAAIGAVADDNADTGAATGAVVGAARGRRQQAKANKQAEAQAQQQAKTQQQQHMDTFRRAFGACMDGKGYSVK